MKFLTIGIQSILLVVFSCHLSLGQNQSKSELKKKLRELKSQAASIESQIKGINEKRQESSDYIKIETDEFTHAEIVRTKDRSGWSTPQYQMIASRIAMDSINIFRIGLNMFTQSSAVNTDKVYVKSQSGVHEFEVTRDNFNVESKTVDASVNWGWGIKTGAQTKIFDNTFFFTVPSEEFFQIISSKDIKVRFSDLGVPDIDIQRYDNENMNMLYFYLTSDDQLNMLTDQLNKIKADIYKTEETIKSL